MSEGAGDLLYLGLDNNDIYQSTDEGATWSLTGDLDWDLGVELVAGLPKPAIDIGSIDQLGDLHLARTFTMMADTLREDYLRRVNGTMLIYSADGGTRSWRAAVDDDLRGRSITSFAINDRGVIVVGTARSGLYRTVESSGVEGEGERRSVIIDLW